MVDSLMHRGTPHEGSTPHSGRYAWGSGEDAYQHAKDFKTHVERMKLQGLSESEIARGFGMSTTEFRAKMSNDINTIKRHDIAKASKLKEKGWSTTAIGNEMGVNESTVRGWLAQANSERLTLTKSVSDELARVADKKGMIDVGKGVEQEIGITANRLNNAVDMLNDKGYHVENVQIPQMGTNTKTTIKVLMSPETLAKAEEQGLSPYVYAKQNATDIQSVREYSVDGGKTFLGIYKPESLDSKRVLIRYAEEGGLQKDGTIELRRGVEDISLGGSSYAQVRIAVDGKYYLKGMALYNDNIPKGYDVVFNTNKHVGTPMEKVLKEMKTKGTDGQIDWDNPFGATIMPGGQRWYTDKDGKAQLSVVNKVNEEGSWGEWSKSLASQFLSKQPMSLIKRQLSISIADKQDEFSDIMSAENPTVRKKLLLEFADECDSAAVDLKAAALPRQSSNVIIPLTSIKENEIYAPNYKNGEQVVLVRYPHGGVFEIPTCTVNNKNKEGKSVIGNNAPDAVGISSKVAERLSGADFDGDTVLVIPVNDKVKVKTMQALEGLVGFDAKEQYKLPDSAPKMKPQTKQTEMGKITNLITDMTFQGATPDELARAVRHSQVIIDAEKHHLDYKQSFEDNRIDELKEKYQGGKNKGASTIISKASATVYIDERKEGKWVTDPETGVTKKQYIDPDTGKKLYTNTNREYQKYKKEDDGTFTPVGPKKKAQQTSTNMYETDDAMTLVSANRHPTELAYANYANTLKALGNTARKEALAVKEQSTNKEAKEKYKAEVDSLNRQLSLALKNAPRERQAQVIANAIVAQKKLEDPSLEADKDKLSKKKGQALKTARERVGAKKQYINISDKEWEAIQAGAISKSSLTMILDNSDAGRVRELAIPRQYNELSTAKQNRIKAMERSGYSNAEIAAAIGCSTTTVNKYINA